VRHCGLSDGIGIRLLVRLHNLLVRWLFLAILLIVGGEMLLRGARGGR
jgi:uncharacterized membrane protein YfcA